MAVVQLFRGAGGVPMKALMPPRRPVLQRQPVQRQKQQQLGLPGAEKGRTAK